MRRAAKKITPLPAPTTDYCADSFLELTNEFIIVAVRHVSDSRDHWRYTWPDTDNKLFRSALRDGIVVAATQRRPAGLVLLGKLA